MARPHLPAREQLAADLYLASLIAAGFTQPEIAARLHLTREAVSHRVTAAMRRSGTSSQAEFAVAMLGRPVPGACSVGAAVDPGPDPAWLQAQRRRQLLDALGGAR